jgi:tetratricopeptide (TPR) repeat protein
MNDRPAAQEYYREYERQVARATTKAASVSGRAELGATLAAAGMLEQAIAELTAVVAADPGHVDATVLLARAHAAKADVASAGRTLEAGVARGLTAAPIYAALAEIYEGVDHLENAIVALRTAIDQDPSNESYRFRYGMLLIRSKAPAAAVIRLQEAVQQFPKSGQLWFALGLAHFSDHKNEEAAAAFDHAIKVQPNLAPALAYRGMVHVAVGKFEEAVELYERALAANDSLAVGHYLLGDALLKQASADTTRAEQHLLRAVSLDGSLVLARLALGKHYLSSGRLEAAAAELEKAIQLEPNLPAAHYQLGRAYARMKRKQESERAFARFEELGKLQREQAVTERQDLVRRLAKVNF